MLRISNTQYATRDTGFNTRALASVHTAYLAYRQAGCILPTAATKGGYCGS